MNTFWLRVVACNRVFFNEHCEEVIFNTEDGEIGFMAHHTPAMTSVSAGEIRIRKKGGEWISAFVSDGIAICANNRITITVFSCELPEEIDLARAEEDEEKAAESLRQKQSIIEYRLSKAAMARAMARIKEANKNRQ